MIVQYLIESGANVMARDDELDNPLHLALKDRGASRFLNGHLRSVQWLLISGTDTHAHNRKGQTPFSMAKQIKGSDVECLFKKGSRIAVYEVVQVLHLITFNRTTVLDFYAATTRQL